MRQIDRKYATDGQIINTIKNTVVPEDEPLVLFRAKDNLLVPLVEHYLKLCTEAGSSQDHLDLLKLRIDDIKTWQRANPDRVGTPGTGWAEQKST